MPTNKPQASVLSETSNAAARVYADGEFACLTWRPSLRALPDFQAAMDALLVLLRRLGTGKALVNQRCMAPLTAAEQAWVLTHWLPRAVAQGHYRYAAVLPAADERARRATERVRADAAHHPGFPRYEDFTDEAQARQWLRRQVVITSSM